MVRTREYLKQFYSDEHIDHEIERVKNAEFGKPVFNMFDKENDELIVSILDLAGVSYKRKKIQGMVFFIKVQPKDN